MDALTTRRRSGATGRRRSVLHRVLERLDDGSRPGLGPAGVVGMAVWLGAVAGLVELGLVLAHRFLIGTVTFEMFRRNHHYVWMIPAANLALFAIVGLLGALVVRISPRRLGRLVPYGLFFLACLAPLRLAPQLHFYAAVLLAGGAARQAGRVLLGRPERGRRLLRRSAGPLGAGLAVLIAGNFWYVSTAERRALAGLPPARAGAPNVLLIVLDTVRADHLSGYGYDRDTTPNLDRLAGRGVRFAQARSTAPWTLPSHASLFTGRWPHELSATTRRALDATYPTLAEYLSGRGYAAAGFTANTHNASGWYGLGRGFARYEDIDRNTEVSPLEVLLSCALGRKLVTTSLGQRLVRYALDGAQYVVRKDAARMNRDALAWLSTRPGDRPWFLFLNYYDAHDPYVPPRGFPRRYGKTVPGQDRFTQARDDYDDCLAYLDTKVGELFGELERRGLSENTLVVLTSDHGENLGERALVGHGISLYRPELHVPLVVLQPDRVPSGRVVAEPVSLRDVAATVVDLAGCGAGAPFPGTSLARSWAGTTGRPDAPFLAEVDRPQLAEEQPHVPAARGAMRAVVAGGRVYIRNGDGAEELYDLEGDPSEARNLAGAEESETALRPFREALGRLLETRAVRR